MVSSDNISYIAAGPSAVAIGNDDVELSVDRATGFFRDIHNKRTGLHHKIEDAGSWPLGLRLGSSGKPDLLSVEITANAAHPQKMQHTVVDAADGKTLRMNYDNLLATTGAASGIRLVVDVTLKNGADYYLIRAHLENKGRYEVTNFFSGSGGLVADVSRDKESLAVPTWDGTVWSNPYQFFAKRQTFGYPIFGTNCGLFAGWMDLYGDKGGIGIGYLNRQGLTMVFSAQQAGKGLGMNWQLFDVEADKRWGAVGGIYPLKPGETFTSDSWIIAPHAGDWHRMADIYRIEYEKAFEGDYLDWQATNETARNIDLVGSYPVRLKGETVSKFDGVPPQVAKVIADTGLDPKNYLVVILGQNSQWPDCMPDFYPCSPEAGGNEGCKAMTAEFRRMGVDGILLYGHAFFNHPKARDYIAGADIGAGSGGFSSLGNVSCTNNRRWLDLWRTKYVPGFDEVGASGAYWDQGPVQYAVCSKAGHTHGTSSVGVLGGHVRGVLDIIQAFKDGFKSRKPMFWCEASSDIQMRTCDIWDCQAKISGGYVIGGSNRQEILRYTFPYRLITDAVRDGSVTDRNDALINGFILWAGPGVNSESPAYLAALRQYVAIRRKLRQVQAPGFPYGFRDTVGLTVGSAAVKARSYRDPKGATILYYATEPVETTITVDRDALGFPGEGAVTFTVKLAKDEAGYRIIENKN